MSYCRLKFPNLGCFSEKRYAYSSRVPSRRISADNRRSLPTLDSQRIGRCTDGRIARLHSGQGTARLLESLERPGLASQARRRCRVGQTENAGGQASRTSRPSTTLRPPAFDAASPHSIGWSRSARNPRGLSRVSRDRSGQRCADHRSSRVRRNLESRGLVEISRRPHAAIPSSLRSAIALNRYPNKLDTVILSIAKDLLRPVKDASFCISLRMANRTNPCPVRWVSQYQKPRPCHPVEVASHQGWVFFSDARRAHPFFSGPGME